MPTNLGTTTNGGPRVSFNRDVHVKRIGKRPNETPKFDYEATSNRQPIVGTQSYHQLPPDIDPADIRKEAALVIAQAERHQSKAENGDNIPSFRVKQKRHSGAANDSAAISAAAASSASSKRFHSLPSRKKKGKPVTRSVSDAAAKKPAKRPSIFGLFSRKSDTNVSQLDRDPRFEDGGGRRLVRSKSDVGSSSGVNSYKDTRRVNKKSEVEASKQQLSPIIEQSQREDYFEEQEQENCRQQERERRKSDAVTVREKHESGLNELLARSLSKAELDGPLLRPERESRQPGISAGIRARIETLNCTSDENMHSSQLPAERLPLTKGRKVDGLVKRLSMERFSPQPVISQPAFSYIRPNEGVTYAQLDLGEERREYAPAPMRPPRATDRHQPSPTRGHGGAPLTTRLNNSQSHSHSPSPWQQLSPRNLSDEDEGLGFETRKLYYEDERERELERREPPIVPVMRSVSPAPYLDELGYRRAQLESRILTRRFGESATLDRGHQIERAYLSPEREASTNHRPDERELQASKYTPHLEAGTLPKVEKTSRYRQTKYYDDGRGGVKEVYVRETQTDGRGKPLVRESRHRERFDNSTERQDCEPKSLDSQFTGCTEQYRSSPELTSRFESGIERGPVQQQQQQQDWQEQSWPSSLKRDKLQQRSFDKGDSGIENDFRKESFNGDITTRWRKRSVIDDIKACESFLRKERRDSAQLQRQLQQRPVPSRLRREHSYVYRERSIDDGSHYDPHLDKYPVATSTLRHREQQSQSREESSTLKRNKKLGGFEKVKQLFTGSANHGSGSGRSSGSNGSSADKKYTNGQGNNSTLSRRASDKNSSNDKDKDKERERYMVREDEMRSRYREHQALHEETSREPKIFDISMRRRLSTPKASPLLLKRSSPDKPTKKENIKPEKMSWFKSLDRRAKSSPKEQVNVSVNGHSEATSMSSLKRTKRNVTAAPAKNLRFFGDTDLDSNPPTLSKANSSTRSRPPLQKHSQSAYNLDRSPPPPSRDYRHTLAGQATRQRSTSMQHLETGASDEVDYRKRRHYSRSRELHDISESGSEPELTERHKRSSGQRAMSLERSAQFHEERPLPSTLLGPPKPARSAERRGVAEGGGFARERERERERYPAESSGTEGDSLHSQRSVVYLHATTVGDIPQPYKQRSISRDDLRKGGGGGKQQPPLQPMTRTVSRSVSMLAPWKPKHISEGYEINYSQEQNKRMATLPRKPSSHKPPPHNGTTSASTLGRQGRRSETPTRRLNGYHKDERHPSRSLLSSSNLRSAKAK